MSRNHQYFQNYEEFHKPIPVYGVGHFILHAYGQGEVTLESTIDHSTHTLRQVWHVPGLQESIVSKYWMKSKGFKTSMDDDENIILTSTTSNFKAVSDYSNKMTIFLKIRALESSTVKSYATTSTSTSVDHDSSTRESSDSSTPAPVADQPPKLSHGQLIHECLGHPCIQRKRIFPYFSLWQYSHLPTHLQN